MAALFARKVIGSLDRLDTFDLDHRAYQAPSSWYHRTGLPHILEIVEPIVNGTVDSFADQASLLWAASGTPYKETSVPMRALYKRAGERLRVAQTSVPASPRDYHWANFVRNVCEGYDMAANSSSLLGLDPLDIGHSCSVSDMAAAIESTDLVPPGNRGVWHRAVLSADSSRSALRGCPFSNFDDTIADPSVSDLTLSRSQLEPLMEIENVVREWREWWSCYGSRGGTSGFDDGSECDAVVDRVGALALRVGFMVTSVFAEGSEFRGGNMNSLLQQSLHSTVTPKVRHFAISRWDDRSRDLSGRSRRWDRCRIAADVARWFASHCGEGTTLTNDNSIWSTQKGASDGGNYCGTTERSVAAVVTVDVPNYAQGGVAAWARGEEWRPLGRTLRTGGSRKSKGGSRRDRGPGYASVDAAERAVNNLRKLQRAAHCAEKAAYTAFRKSTVAAVRRMHREEERKKSLTWSFGPSVMVPFTQDEIANLNATASVMHRSCTVPVYGVMWGAGGTGDAEHGVVRGSRPTASMPRCGAGRTNPRTEVLPVEAGGVGAGVRQRGGVRRARHLAAADAGSRVGRGMTPSTLYLGERAKVCLRRNVRRWAYAQHKREQKVGDTTAAAMAAVRDCLQYATPHGCLAPGLPYHKEGPCRLFNKSACFTVPFAVYRSEPALSFEPQCSRRERECKDVRLARTAAKISHAVESFDPSFHRGVETISSSVARWLRGTWMNCSTCKGPWHGFSRLLAKRAVPARRKERLAKWSSGLFGWGVEDAVIDASTTLQTRARERDSAGRCIARRCAGRGGLVGVRFLPRRCVEGLTFAAAARGDVDGSVRYMSQAGVSQAVVAGGGSLCRESMLTSAVSTASASSCPSSWVDVADLLSRCDGTAESVSDGGGDARSGASGSSEDSDFSVV